MDSDISKNQTEKSEAFRILSKILSLLNQALANESSSRGNIPTLSVVKLIHLFQGNCITCGFALLSNGQEIYFELGDSQIQYTDILSYIEGNLCDLLEKNGYTLRRVYSHDISRSQVIGKAEVCSVKEGSISILEFRITDRKVDIFHS